ncbi:MAG: RNA ligase (ATP) [Planctomycetaceae bacterium]|jgi:RNA ligase (TIGR02306 family)|nr:RNA ligase (ATP) [Planctomycetaceae bacterium]
MRKLATVTKVKELRPIEGADFIEVATMTTNGWVCVAKKGDFNVGDFGVYFEIDSFLPKEERYAFLDGRSDKKMNGTDGYRLRTIKLKKQISQGLLLPLSDFPEITKPKEGDDVTELLKVKLYEPTDNRPTRMIGGSPMRRFPAFIRKTDQERIQSFDTVRLEALNGKQYEVTEKLDGTSVTIYYRCNHFGVCSRNYEVACTEFYRSLFAKFKHWIKRIFFKDEFEKRFGFSRSIYEEMSVKYNLHEKLPELCRELHINLAIQGEIVGTNVSDNRLGLNDVDLYVFDVFNIDTQKYVDAYVRYDIVNWLGLKHVPVICESYALCLDETSVKELVDTAFGRSKLSDKIREGLVYKERGEFSQYSFKTISNAYLLEHKL